jgi:hypothetical protein
MSELLLSKPGLLSSWVSTQAGAAVVVVDSAWAVVVDSANVVVVVTPAEAILVSDAIDDELSARSVSVVIAVGSVKMVVVASARVVIAVESKEVVKGRQGPASTPEKNRATAAAVKLEKRTILVKWENKLLKRMDRTADSAVRFNECKERDVVEESKLAICSRCHPF